MTQRYCCEGQDQELSRLLVVLAVVAICVAPLQGLPVVALRDPRLRPWLLAFATSWLVIGVAIGVSEYSGWLCPCRLRASKH